jgi:hypothetical protein
MDDSYPHLRIFREEPVNERRPGTYFPPQPPSDTAAFGKRLQASLQRAIEHTSQDLGGFDDRRLFRFEVRETVIGTRIDCNVNRNQWARSRPCSPGGKRP